jgi:hypothetical protein
MTNENKHPEYVKALEVLRDLAPWDLIKLFIEAHTGIDVKDTEYYPDDLEDSINECAGEICEIINRVKSESVVIGAERSGER